MLGLITIGEAEAIVAAIPKAVPIFRNCREYSSKTEV
jgi:hypothetical protein